jgi:hypothetical protein
MPKPPRYYILSFKDFNIESIKTILVISDLNLLILKILC